MRHSPVLNMEHQNRKITKSCRALICSLATFVKIMASLSIRFKYQLYKILMKSEHGRQDYHSFKEIWTHYVCFGQLPLVPRKTANPVLTVSANFWTPERNTAFIFAWTSPGLHSLNWLKNSMLLVQLRARTYGHGRFVVASATLQNILPENLRF